MSQTEFDLQIEKHRIVPVVKIESIESALPLANALAAAGLPVAEITLRTGCALQAIEAFANVDGMVLGAGTVLNLQQAKDAVNAGAQFIVSPGFDEQTVEYCLENSIPIYPGTSTASEIQRALNRGLRTIKFFPAEASGGTKMLKALAGPFRAMRFMPTGGVNLENLEDYLSLDCVIAVGGSWMVKPELFSDGNFDQVVEQTKNAVKLCKSF